MIDWYWSIMFFLWLIHRFWIHWILNREHKYLDQYPQALNKDKPKIRHFTFWGNQLIHTSHSTPTRFFARRWVHIKIMDPKLWVVSSWHGDFLGSPKRYPNGSLFIEFPYCLVQSPNLFGQFKIQHFLVFNLPFLTVKSKSLLVKPSWPSFFVGSCFSC